VPASIKSGAASIGIARQGRCRSFAPPLGSSHWRAPSRIS
jgi:hypothetical protein